MHQRRGMARFVTAGMGFLLAVLWFDLMFDVQTRGHSGEVLPLDVLASISGYYGHVTTAAYPMNRLVSTVMLLTILAVCIEIYQDRTPRWVSWGTLLLMCVSVYFTLTGTVPNAVRLGSGIDTPAVQSELARSIYADHVMAFARVLVLLGLQFYFGDSRGAAEADQEMDSAESREAPSESRSQDGSRSRTS